METRDQNWIDEIRFNDQGLIPAVAQDAASGRVLMVAFMNRESVAQTARTGIATYWSRSRQSLWVKGETSGHEQRINDIQLDCDGDVLVLKVEQMGGIACHTGRNSCFYRTLTEDGWQISEPVLKDPEEMYPNG